MALKLFEMSATLTLDTSEFDTGATKAIEKSGEIETAINNISTDSVDAEIAALGKDIARLDKEIASWDTEITDIEDDLDTMDEKASAAGNVMQGFIEVAKEVALAGFEMIRDFAMESLSQVENSGSKAGNILKNAKQDWNLSLDSMRTKTGEVLAPIVGTFYDLAASITGVTDNDRLTTLLANLDAYSFQNLQRVRESLEGIFATFEKYTPTETDTLTNVTDMTSALESQITYWKSYASLMDQLRERGVSDDFLAQYADGSKSSYDMLRSMGRASDEELSALQETFEELENARTDAAETINQSQLEVDQTVADMNDAISRLGVDIATEEGANNVYTAAQGIINTLAASYPSISSQVNRINNKLSHLGGIDDKVRVFATPYGGFGPRAVGMENVPYDGWAYLHEGEGVLTKAENTVRRRGEGGGVQIDYDRLGRSVTAAMIPAMAGMSIQMDKQTVGRMIAPTVNREIARDVQKRRYG